MPTDIYTLLVQVGRKAGDGLPKGASGAALLCYCPADDEGQAVRETVAILKDAGLAPLDVTAYGTRAEREMEADEVSEDEAMLMDRALADDSVVIAQLDPLYDKA